MTYTCTWPDGSTENVTLLELNGSTAKIERVCGQVQWVKGYQLSPRVCFAFSSGPYARYYQEYLPKIGL